MRASIGVCVLLVPVLVLGGGAAALASTTTDYEALHVASVAYEAARDNAADARISAGRSLDRYLALAADAKLALGTGADLQAVGSDLLDATATAALGPLRDALTAALADPAPTLVARPPAVHDSDPAALTAATAELAEWSVELRDEWSVHDASIAEIDTALRRLRTGIMAVAGSVAAKGQSILDASGSASSETRAALSSAIARVADHIEDGTDPSADLTAYLAAAKAVKDSHAESIAAAAALSSGGSGGGVSRQIPAFPFGQGTDPNNPPQVYFSGAYVGAGCDWGAAANLVSAVLVNGEVYYFSSDVPYEGRLLNGDIQWYLVINACATGP